ncbi:LPS-assembly protein LptD [Roseimaritima multifibrata]|uniref:LPS-assembly protein LptD n=1 Tax=Roseimaritima multifibrata TaxID=1930274 RepID=A0A517M945_9BACT|nr:LPS-assembly protein LptD [Roseimaritima multifibrata]
MLNPLSALPAERNDREVEGCSEPRSPTSLSAARRRSCRSLLVASLVMIIGWLGGADAYSARPAETQAAGLRVRGTTVWRWRDGATDLYFLTGDCEIESNGKAILADRVLVKFDRRGDAFDVVALASGSVHVDGQSQQEWSQQVTLSQRPSIDGLQYRGRPEQPLELLARMTQLQGQPIQGQPIQGQPHGRFGQVQQAQLMTPIPAANSAAYADGGVQQAVGIFDPAEPLQATSPIRPVQFQPPVEREGPLGDNNMRFLVGGGALAVEVLPRNASLLPQISIRTRPLPGETQGESVIIGRGGVTIAINDAQADLGDRIINVGTVSLSADRVVGWMPNLSSVLSGGGLGAGDGELYLEGDIVFRQGDRVIYADRMYYNVTRQYGMVLDAEVLTSIPEYEGLVRLKADVLQQVSQGEFVAFDAALTTSRMGVPRYWLQSEQLRLSTREELVVDDATGLGTMTRRNLVSSNRNFVYAGGVPLLYWPVFTSDLKHSNLYVTDIKIKNDSIFGTQLFLDFDLFQVLGVDDPPDNVEWTLSTDYLSDRGPALGTTLDYNVPSVLGIPGPVKGMFDIWGIDDSGLDYLANDRKNLVPPVSLRGRALLRHRHYLPNDFELIAELGLISDRNFLEQYLEREWDRDKDQDNSLRLRKYYQNNMFDLNVSVRTSDFFMDTNQLPRFDHYGLGGSIFGDRLTWSMHNQIGYSKLEVADAPEDPVELAKFTLLPGEVPAEGLIASTKQELAAPINAGVVKVVPYVSGEVTYYGEDVNGNELTRLLGQGGVRTTLPMSKQFPTVQSSLLNIRSLAHKLEWRGDFFYADSNTDLDQIPLYDQLDDDSQEQFRRRLIFDNFGGPPLPTQYDPRNFAFRQGMQSHVTSPSNPIADDLMQVRLGLNQRWQTKRGLPGRERIVDLAIFDFDVLLFPEEDRDNFGEVLGPTRYDFRYHVGDRVTLLSDGYFDFFEEGLRSVSAGVMSSRPGLGDIYVGFLSLEGPISSSVLRGAVDYRLNEKWILGAGSTFDLGVVGNVGQNLTITRIGESGLLRMGINVDSGRDNVGFVFSFEPRFWPKRRLGMLGGQLIPPPGVEGLE